MEQVLCKLQHVKPLGTPFPGPLALLLLSQRKHLQQQIRNSQLLLKNGNVEEDLKSFLTQRDHKAPTKRAHHLVSTALMAKSTQSTDTKHRCVGSTVEKGREKVRQARQEQGGKNKREKWRKLNAINVSTQYKTESHIPFAAPEDLSRDDSVRRHSRPS